MEPRSFKASYSLTTWIITVIVIAIIYIPAIALIIPSIQTGSLQLDQLREVAVAIVLLLFVPAIGLFAPIKFRVDSFGVTICRIGPNVVIPADSIVEVKRVCLRCVWRTCGVGGLFGSWGWFRGAPLGSFRGYMTRKSNCVALIRKGKPPVVVTPIDPDTFVDAVKTAFHLNRVS